MLSHKLYPEFEHQNLNAIVMSDIGRVLSNQMQRPFRIAANDSVVDAPLIGASLFSRGSHSVLAKLQTKISKGIAKGTNESILRLYKKLNIVRRRSPFDNIFHCCTQKTASQWFRALLRDRVVYKYTGLGSIPFIRLGDEWKYADCEFDMEIPARNIITQLYIGYPTYQRIPKPEKYKTLFVLRDPRDIVVSWYFSTKISHRLVSYIPEYRKKLVSMDVAEGFKFTIDVMEQGIFPMQRSWVENAADDNNIILLRYEDFAANNRKFLATLFQRLEIDIPKKELDALYERHSFKKATRGRAQGSEDLQSHNRKGIAGDWKNHFSAEISDYFDLKTNGLLEQLGYEKKG